MGIVITFALGVFLLLGAAVVILAKHKKRIEQLSIAIAFGTMVMLAAIELIPEIFETFHGSGLILAAAFVLAGVVVLKLLDHFIPDHEHVHGHVHGHGHGHSHEHAHDQIQVTEHTEEEPTEGNVIHIGIISAVAIILHNIVEGMAVYSIASESVKIGILVGLGVGLHNIPMGMLVYSTLKEEARGKRFLIMGMAAVSTLFGGILMALISPVLSETVIGCLICLALGMLIYIIFFELLPHLFHCRNRWLSVAGTLLGILIILISSLFE